MIEGGIVLAIDPGPKKSGLVLFASGRVIEAAECENDDVLARCSSLRSRRNHLSIEMIASYGMPVGAEVFETALWTGRFVQNWIGRPPQYPSMDPPALLYRKEVVLHLCNNPRGNDSSVRQALIDKLGAPGTKKNPGPTYGISGHLWQALAVAVTYAETRLR